MVSEPDGIPSISSQPPSGLFILTGLNHLKHKHDLVINVSPS